MSSYDIHGRVHTYVMVCTFEGICCDTPTDSRGILFVVYIYTYICLLLDVDIHVYTYTYYIYIYVSA